MIQMQNELDLRKAAGLPRLPRSVIVAPVYIPVMTREGILGQILHDPSQPLPPQFQPAPLLALNAPGTQVMKLPA